MRKRRFFYPIYTPFHLHLGLDLLQQPTQLILIRRLSRPPNPQPLALIRLRNQMEMHMIDLLMRQPSIILQYIVILHALRDGNFLGNGQDFSELVIGDVVEFSAVVFGDDELGG